MTDRDLRKLAELVAVDPLPPPCEKGAYIYFAQARNEDGFIKIGYAKDLSRRRTNMRTATPYPVDIVASYYPDDHRAHEAFLHEKFKHVRVRREWFLPTPQLLALISKVRDAHAEWMRGT